MPTMAATAMAAIWTVASVVANPLCQSRMQLARTLEPCFVIGPPSDSPIAMATPSIELFKDSERSANPGIHLFGCLICDASRIFQLSESNARVSVTDFPMADADVIPSRPNTSLNFAAFSAEPRFFVASATSPSTSTSGRAYFPAASIVATPKTF